MEKTKSKSTSSKYVFRQIDNIGAADAIDDKRYLQECFVDTGLLDVLADLGRPECVLVGRTGTGKTALLEQLTNIAERVIQINPDDLALSYVSNSDVLIFFTELGVNMDLFYRLLWRHVFVVELIRTHFGIVNEQTRDNFLIRIKELLSKNRSKQDAIEYLRLWGESFWEETVYRVKEVTTTLEHDLTRGLRAGLQTAIPSAGQITMQFDRKFANSLTEEQIHEAQKIGQSIVNRIQIQKLSEVIRILENDILEDKKKKYYITIDRLDENWVDDKFRYYLIRSLLETARELNHQLSNVKIILALREDLLDRVFRETRSPGYQEEKFKSTYINLIWSEQHLTEVVNRRVEKLIREKYTTRPLTLASLLPTTLHIQKKKIEPLDYMLERTLCRPRDIIMFFNQCILASEGQPKITQTSLFRAEVDYSEKRLRALGDEWSADYLTLFEVSRFLRSFPASFRYEDVDHEFFLDWAIEYLAANSSKATCRVYEQLSNLLIYSQQTNTEEAIQYILKILYRVGVLGIGTVSSKAVVWSFQNIKFENGEHLREAVFHIHPAFWKVLAIRTT